MSLPRIPIALLCALLGEITVLSGCSGDPTGDAGDGDGSNGAASGQDGEMGTGSTAGDGLHAQPGALTARAWRLNHQQYAKSVFQLVGVEPDLSNFQPESGNGKFQNFSSTNFVDVDLAANYYRVAKSIAASLSTAELSALNSCGLAVACKDAFISEVGEKAFRSEIPAEVAARLSEIFELASSEVDAETGYRAVLMAVLNSPLFLYRKEIGPAENSSTESFSLTQDQIAELLSFSLLGSPPPPWLRESARNGELNLAGLSPVIERLMMVPEFNEQLNQFLAEWLEVNQFNSVEKFDVFPGFDLVKPLMVDELFAFLKQSGTSDSTMLNLLLDPVPSVGSALDNFYYSDPSAPQTGERLGALQLGTVLASHAKTYLTSPTLRGTFIRKRFFCTEINLPDGFTPPPLTDAENKGIAKTTRELYEIHQQSPVCAECHRLTDNIGFALEEFDGAGRFRTEDSTQGPPVPLDLQTEITDSDVDRPLTSAKDLSVALSESNQVKQCMAQQAFRFFFGQVEGSPAMRAVAAGTAGLQAGGTLGQLAKGVLSTEDTLLRNRQEMD